jgi:hypothetical protein
VSRNVEERMLRMIGAADCLKEYVLWWGQENEMRLCNIK